jgi:hypothetical protein
MPMFKRLLWSKPAAITRYGVAIVSIGLSVLISEFLDSRWKSAPFVSVFTCAIPFFVLRSDNSSVVHNVSIVLGALVTEHIQSSSQESRVESQV